MYVIRLPTYLGQLEVVLVLSAGPEACPCPNISGCAHSCPALKKGEGTYHYFQQINHWVTGRLNT